MIDRPDAAAPGRYRLPAYLLLLAVIAAVCICIFHLRPPDPPARYRLAQAQLVDAAGVARSVALPYRHEHANAMQLPFTYLMNFDYRPSGDEARWSVFLPGYTSGIEVAVNGAVVLDTRLHPGAGRVDRNTPAIAFIPPSLLREGANEVRVRLFVWGPISGYLDRLYVGPDAELRPAYDTRFFLFSTVPLLLAAWQGLLGAILGLIWLNRRREAVYGWLTAAMAVGMTQYFMSMPASQWVHGFLGAAGALEAALMLQFVVHFVGLKHVARWRLAFIPGLVILAAGLFGRPEDLRIAYIALGPAFTGLFMTTMACILGWSAVVKGARSSVFLGCTLTVVVVFWAHDIASLLNFFGAERIFLGRLSYSLVLIAIGIGLTWRFVQALNEADKFAGQLVLRVREAEDKLRASFTREEERARDEARAAERTRLMRDLHDGLGGQLVSIVALAEQMGGIAAQIGDAARAALRDLRLVIDAMEEVDGDLMLVLGSWRERISTQLRAHGIQLSWQVLTPGGLPVFPGLRPWVVIQIVRLLDEAVTNAIKHSGAGTLQVLIETVVDAKGSAGGRITIADDGKGFDVGQYIRDAGSREIARGPVARRGLANMRKRAELCGGQLTFASDAAGTRVSLALPADLGTAGGGESRISS